jgi:hypothetical protein
MKVTPAQRLNIYPAAVPKLPIQRLPAQAMVPARAVSSQPSGQSVHLLIFTANGCMDVSKILKTTLPYNDLRKGTP